MKEYIINLIFILKMQIRKKEKCKIITDGKMKILDSHFHLLKIESQTGLIIGHFLMKVNLHFRLFHHHKY